MDHDHQEYLVLLLRTDSSIGSAVYDVEAAGRAFDIIEKPPVSLLGSQKVKRTPQLARFTRE